MRRASTPATAFYVLNVLLFPVTLIGYLLWIVGGLARANESKVSMTAQGPLTARWTMHEFGVRRDVAAARIMPILPGVPCLASRLTSFPMFFAHRVTGFVPKTFRYPFVGAVPPQLEAAARVTFFDDIVERSLPDIDQLVILGAGFDTRPYRLPRNTSVRSFEVDLPATQEVKRRVLEEGGVDTRGVTFVPADFEKDDWLAELIDAGLDIKRPTLFVWEGVIIYLDRAAVAGTLRTVARCAKGTLIAFDYFTSLVDSSAPYWRFARAATQRGGEPIKFGIDATPPLAERVTELLAACGLTLREQRTLGDESDSRRALGRVHRRRRAVIPRPAQGEAREAGAVPNASASWGSATTGIAADSVSQMSARRRGSRDSGLPFSVSYDSPAPEAGGAATSPARRHRFGNGPRERARLDTLAVASV